MNPLQRLRGSRVVVIDTETTGLSGTDRLIEVALVVIDALFESEPRPLFASLIAPGIPIPWESTRVHGLRDEDVAGAPAWPEVYAEVGAHLCGLDTVLCAHNAPFDRRFLNSEPTPVPPTAHWLDTMRICQRLGVGAVLGDACRLRGLPLDGHRAATDALATAHLLHALIPEAYASPAPPPPRPSVGQWLDWQRKRRTAEVAAQPPLFSRGNPA
jgi:DNA polymerase-3 subunit epsilon